MLRARLFGELAVQRAGSQSAIELGTRRVQELFAYLILHRGHPQRRELLSDVLWGEAASAQSRKYLRHTLWQLQTALERGRPADEEPMLFAAPESINMNAAANLWLDIRSFEDAWSAVEGVAGAQLEANAADLLKEAVDVYRGELLEGWYHDWCLFERERLHNVYLSMLDKLVTYSEACREYEAGLAYAERILRCDRAHERTHRRMMRLYFLAGDRTAALRQYERCLTALREELDVAPQRRTRALYEQIKLDGPGGAASTEAARQPLLGSLTELDALLEHTQRQVREQIQHLRADLSTD